MVETLTIEKPKKEATDKTLIIREALKNPHYTIKKQVMGNLFYFIQYFWDTYSGDEFIANWHIRKLCKELEEVARRVAENKPKEYDLIINVPPGTTKTALVSIMFPVWCWTNWYWLRFMTSSHSSTLSLESAEYSRDIIRSDKFKQMFPELEIRQDKDVKSNFRIVKKVKSFKGVMSVTQGGSRVSTSVAARIIGFHAHIIIWDDLIDPAGAISEAEMRKAISHLDQTLSQRKVNRKISVTVGVMQRLGQNDPTQHLLSKEKKKIRHICLPGEISNYGKYLKPPEWKKYYVDDLLDTKRMTWSILDEMLVDLGQYGYAGQVGQNPSPPGGGMFKVDHISIRDQFPPSDQIVQVVRYWDKAGTKDGGAYTVGVKMIKLKSGIYLIPDIKRGQWASEEREKIIKQTAEADGQRCKVYVEQEPGSGGKESADGTIRNLVGFSVYKDRPTGDKVYRADPYSVQVNLGMVQMMKGGWNQAYIEELELFPNSTFKDQTDASSGAFNKLVGKRKVRVGR